MNAHSSKGKVGATGKGRAGVLTDSLTQSVATCFDMPSSECEAEAKVDMMAAR